MTESDEDQPERAAGGQDLPAGAALYALFLCVLFGANAVAIKISLGGLGVFTTAGLRFSLAAAAIWLYARLSGKSLRLNGKQWQQLLLLGLIFFCQLSLFYLGQSRTTATHGTLIVNALPFVVAVLAHFFLTDDRLSATRIIGLTFGFAGVLVLLRDSLEMSREAVTGDLLVLAAVLVWGANAIYSKRIISTFHPAQITFYPMVLATPFFLICGVLFDRPMLTRVDPAILAALFYQTFVTASFGMVAWSSLAKRYGASSLHAFVFIMPISGTSLGVILLGEPLTLNLLGAAALVTVGLLVVNRKRRKLM
ncbi:DMT family transporter [Desulfofustis limnaeus]|jgi:drug/metabolite transporter (DMT)-like permease|uniref:Membrane protein n=1 Tax=Desulfofustis limnaeus TaxID=2740163 RepID=A0ABM7WDC3_9BACT|nr:DMT family transporter [Desulfofustis limnaeus]MDX9894019.1 DMT family transporter [Desulfofustis sp.]BDD88964.1 membrane protein [Desulfofustis limnaeus]